jgi:hypothetical protein
VGYIHSVPARVFGGTIVTDADLKALAEKATPQPWSCCGDDRGGCQCGFISAPDFPVAKATIGVWGDSYPAIRLKKGTGSIEGSYEAYMERIDYGEVDEAQGKANAAYISAACNETPRLLARIAALRDALAIYDRFATAHAALAADDKAQE